MKEYFVIAILMIGTYCHSVSQMVLTHWGWVTHICISKLTINVSDSGLSPGRHQAIVWMNHTRILFIGRLGTNFSEILIEIHIFSFKKMHLKMLSGNWRPFCLVLNVLTRQGQVMHIYTSQSILPSLVLNNGLSPVLCQTIFLTNSGFWLVGPLQTNFSEIQMKSQ